MAKSLVSALKAEQPEPEAVRPAGTWQILRADELECTRADYALAKAALAKNTLTARLKALQTVIDKCMDDELRSAVLRFVHDMGILHGRMEAVSFSGSDSDVVNPTVD